MSQFEGLFLSVQGGEQSFNESLNEREESRVRPNQGWEKGVTDLLEINIVEPGEE